MLPQLANCAVQNHESKGRQFVEKFNEFETKFPFALDRSRIVESAAFRRLQYKTQVFVNHQGDHFRTRLTHSLEVAQIALRIALQLNLNRDLTEIIALAHDLGHPPFGHAGEEALNQKMKQFGGFLHNDFGLKIVSKIESKFFGFSGLNLSWEVLEGIVKHNGALHPAFDLFEEKNQNSQSNQRKVEQKIELASDFIADFNRNFDLNLSEMPSLEAQVAAIADDIAYNNHDIEDGLRAGFFAIEELFELPLIGEIYQNIFTKTLQNSASQKYFLGASNSNRELLISIAKNNSSALMIDDLIKTTQKNLIKNQIESQQQVASYSSFLVEFSNEMQLAINELRKFLMAKLYRHYQVNRMSVKGKKIVANLFDFYFQNPNCLPFNTSSMLRNVGNFDSEKQLANLVCTYIAGMTDRFAIKEHSEIINH